MNATFKGTYRHPTCKGKRGTTSPTRVMTLICYHLIKESTPISLGLSINARNDRSRYYVQATDMMSAHYNTYTGVSGLTPRHHLVGGQE